MRKPEIIGVFELYDTALNVQCEWTLPNGKKRWGPARAYGWNQLRPLGRFKAAWLVFTGRADALTWPTSGHAAGAMPCDGSVCKKGQATA